MAREILPSRRGHIVQKARIGATRTLYLSVDSATQPKELWLRIKGGDEDAEKVVLYDVIARLISFMLQESIPIPVIAEKLWGTKDDTGGPVKGDTRIRMCQGTVDYVGKHLLVYYGGREDLAHSNHVENSTQSESQQESSPQATEKAPPKDPPEGKAYCPVIGNH